MTFELGKTIGGYEFLEELETKGAGLSFKVFNEAARRLEVLKVLSRELRDDEERVERFRREVKIHERLSHPHLAAFYRAFEIEGQMVMTIEWLDGETLAAKISRGPLPLEEVLAAASKVLSALEDAHANGVVHRNLSPSCLIFTAGDIVKVTDFELAKTSSDPRLTLTGTVFGPMYYIAPEQVKGETALDARTDIYSLGMVLYEALTGHKAFGSGSQFEVMQSHVRVMPPPPSEIRAGLPPELDRIVLTAVAKDRDNRFGSVRLFREALEQVPGTAEAPAPQAMAAGAAAAPVPQAMAAGAAPAPAPSTQSPGPVETALPDKIVETWVAKKLPAAPTAEPRPAVSETTGPQRRTLHDLLYDGGELDPRVVGLITFVATLILCFVGLAIFR